MENVTPAIAYLVPHFDQRTVAQGGYETDLALDAQGLGIAAGFDLDVAARPGPLFHRHFDYDVIGVGHKGVLRFQRLGAAFLHYWRLLRVRNAGRQEQPDPCVLNS